jgi:dsDNA-binding SOS-regulon protein
LITKQGFIVSLKESISAREEMLFNAKRDKKRLDRMVKNIGILMDIVDEPTKDRLAAQRNEIDNFIATTEKSLAEDRDFVGKLEEYKE